MQSSTTILQTVLSILALGILCAARAAGQCGELEMLLGSGGSASDEEGVDVDIDGDVAVVGSFVDDPNGNDSGSAYVYRYDKASATWVEEQKLTAGALGSGGDYFGRGVCVSGDVIAIGAPLDDDDANPAITDKGSVYVFRYDPGQKMWLLDGNKKLTASNGNAGDQFGFSVDLGGDLLAIGARLDDDCAADSGSVYVFRYAGSFLGWLNETQLQGSGCSGGDELGLDVAVRRDDAEGDRVVAGSYLDDPKGTNSGSVSVFRRDPVTKQWSEEQRLIESGGAGFDQFGVSVALDECLLIGAYGDDNQTFVDAGAAHVFEYDAGAGQWTQRDLLLPSAPSQSELFGRSVGVCGEVIVVGAYLDDLTFSNTGSASVFRRCGTSWVLDDILAPKTRGNDDYFGFSVAVSGNRALCGAYLDNTSKGTDSGAAYVFGASEIELSMTPASVMPGAAIEVSMFYGKVGEPVLFIAASLNGTPIFHPLFLATFGADHTLTFSANAPSSLSGTTVGFQAYEVEACGGITGSNVVLVGFQ